MRSEVTLEDNPEVMWEAYNLRLSVKLHRYVNQDRPMWWLLDQAEIRNVCQKYRYREQQRRTWDD